MTSAAVSDDVTAPGGASRRRRRSARPTLGLSDEAGGRALAAKVTKVEYQAVADAAARFGLTISALLRRVIRDYLVRLGGGDVAKRL